MNGDLRGALFVAAALVAAATLNAPSAAAKPAIWSSNIPASTGCHPYLGGSEHDWGRMLGGRFNTTSAGQYLVCTAPEDNARILSHSFRVVVGGREPNTGDAPFAQLCALYWDRGGASCAAAVVDTPSNTGDFALDLNDTSPWHGTRSRQYDYPVVFAYITAADCSGTGCSYYRNTIYGINVFFQ